MIDFSKKRLTLIQKPDGLTAFLFGGNPRIKNDKIVGFFNPLVSRASKTEHWFESIELNP